jgi:hypothetical protein
LTSVSKSKAILAIDLVIKPSVGKEVIGRRPAPWCGTYKYYILSHHPGIFLYLHPDPIQYEKNLIVQ